MPARIGLALDPLTDLWKWRNLAQKSGMEPWYLAAEAVSREGGRDRVQDHNLNVGDLMSKAQEFGSSLKSTPFTNKRNPGKWTEEYFGLDDVTDSPTHQFTQARLYTFLQYRRGLENALAQVPYTAERAVHAYIRTALTWVERWPGLTRATMSEQKKEHDELSRLRKLNGGVKLSSAQRYEATFALPIILEDDIADLLEADEQERGRDESPRPSSEGLRNTRAAFATRFGLGISKRKHPDETIVPAQQLVGKIRLAAIAMIEDPSLRVLSAYNKVREGANDELGGALARARLSFGDYKLAAKDEMLLAEIRSHTWATRSPEEREKLLRNSPAWRTAFGSPDAEEDAE